jgi:hypothetical protein
VHGVSRVLLSTNSIQHQSGVALQCLSHWFQIEPCVDLGTGSVGMVKCTPNQRQTVTLRCQPTPERASEVVDSDVANARTLANPGPRLFWFNEMPGRAIAGKNPVASSVTRQ